MNVMDEWILITRALTNDSRKNIMIPSLVLFIDSTGLKKSGLKWLNNFNNTSELTNSMK